MSSTSSGAVPINPPVNPPQTMKNVKDQLTFTVAESNIKLGSLRIRGHNLKYFPGGARTTKIQAVFET